MLFFWVFRILGQVDQPVIAPIKTARGIAGGEIIEMARDATEDVSVAEPGAGSGPGIPEISAGFGRPVRAGVNRLE
jgi:hypothetical protein